MEKETSTFNLIEKFNEIANYVKEKFGANIWFVELLGRRLSYVAGHREDSFLPPEVIYLNERFAVVSNEWEKIPEKEGIVKVLKMAIKEGKQ
jgi:hypothetical protein